MTPDTHSSFDALLREAAELRVPASQAIELPKLGAVLENRYRIEEKLAAGGMGAIFRAANVETGKQVAIKWLLGRSPQAGLRFSREARVTAQIDHPNVVNVFDCGSHQGGRYLVMELLRGESLGARIRRGRIAADELLEVMVPVLRGLAAAHRAGVIHRDLKPDNVFLCVGPDGAPRQPKVLDFGISKLRTAPALDERLTGQGTGLGTLAYMSPEQLVDAPNVDERTDIYAAGAMMYEALTGCLPFRAEGYNALVLAIAAQKPLPIAALVSDVPPPLARIVMRALAKEPNERQPHAQALIDELEALRLSFPTGARNETPAPASWLRWAGAACLGLPLSVSIWLAAHPPDRTAQAPRTPTSVAAAQGAEAMPEQRRERDERAAALKVADERDALAEKAPPGTSSVVAINPARVSAEGRTRASLPARAAGMVQARQTRAPARSRAGNIRWSDL